MPRSLYVIAGAGLATSFVCLSLAAALDGDDALDRHLGWRGFFSGCDSGVDAGTTGDTREFAWDGGDEVTINVPATIRYRPGVGTSITASGSPELLRHLRVRNGRIEFDCWGLGYHDRLDVVLPGVPLASFTLNGSGTLVLEELNQRELEIDVRGSGEVRATGSAQDVDLDIAGSGEAYLGALSSQRVEISIAGSGEAEIAPQDEADIRIAGSGEIRLLRQPARLQTRIAGSGRIVNAAGPGAAPAAP
jgi:hypothetical protein